MPRAGPRLVWNGVGTIGPTRYTCAFCDSTVGPNTGYFGQVQDTQNGQARIYICSNCTYPTLMVGSALPGNPELQSAKQTPAPSYGATVGNLPANIGEAYDEARECMTVRAYTAAAIICRKLLMNVAVDKGAPAGKHFDEYVDYLVDNGLVAATHKTWVDKIRKVGNEAAHDFAPRTEADAKTIIDFSEMLLKTVYDYTARA